MKKVRCSLLLALVVLISNSLNAQNTQTSSGGHQSASTVVRDANAVALVQQFLAASGSLASTNHATHAIGSITYARTKETKTIEIKTLGTNYIRYSIGSDFTSARNDIDGWINKSGKIQKVPYHAIAYKRSETLPGLLLVTEIEQPNLNCKYVGIEDVNGSPAHHIRLSMLPHDSTDPDLVHSEDLLSETHIWVDEKSGLITRSRVFDFHPQAIENRSPVDIYYSDYRNVNGFMVPFHIIKDVERKRHSEIVFTSVDVSANLSASDFQQ